MRSVIEDIRGLKLDIKMAFEVEDSKRGVFARRGKLDSLLKEVIEAIDDYTEFVSEPQILAPKCQHKYRDYPWYLEWGKNANRIDYKIIEPYLCIHCGERKNVVLESGRIILKDGETEEEVLASFKRAYPQLQNKPVVEDAINDAILVDREYLRIADYLRGNGDLKKEIELKMGV